MDKRATRSSSYHPGHPWTRNTGNGLHEAPNPPQRARRAARFSAHVPPTLILNGRDEPCVAFNYRAPGALSRALRQSAQAN
ncbi:hypothetical protein C8J57DRAFT_1511011 [Mycena rebaudengoi]|nr:hypothetical protein C8J57DRAFT_1511011 [Mycena rebaudengoi]